MRIVDALTLPGRHRQSLLPGEHLIDHHGTRHPLPRFFYEIESWEAAKKCQLTAHFTLAELTAVDCREARSLFKETPRYVPCAVRILARYLETFRERVDAPVYVSVNGGYRSPAHQRSQLASVHCWATAADIYRIGDTWMDSQKSIERFARIAESIGPEIVTKKHGAGPGQTDDHLHLDLGYLTLVPAGCCDS